MASSRSATKPAAGDKIFVGGSPADRKVFIEDVIECIRLKGAKKLLVTTAELSEYLKQQPTLSPSNLFRKQYGNLDHVFNYEQMRDLFLLDGAVIRLQPQPLLERARDGGLISDELLAKCIAMHRFKRVHDLTTMKNTGQNECAVCRRPYPMLANNSRACDNGENHRPAFDWDKAEDVLQCEIRQ